jgi:hypothetical protein
MFVVKSKEGGVGICRTPLLHFMFVMKGGRRREAYVKTISCY